MWPPWRPGLVLLVPRSAPVVHGPALRCAAAPQIHGALQPVASARGELALEAWAAASVGPANKAPIPQHPRSCPGILAAGCTPPASRGRGPHGGKDPVPPPGAALAPGCCDVVSVHILPSSQAFRTRRAHLYNVPIRTTYCTGAPPVRRRPAWRQPPRTCATTCLARVLCAPVQATLGSSLSLNPLPRACAVCSCAGHP
jgi:hypothetical protein